MSRRALATFRHALRLSPGILDAALSSLAGFATSLYAVGFLEPEELGTYALYLSASVVGGLFPQQLVYLPGQIAVLEVPAASRATMLPSTLLRGALLSLFVMPFVAVAGLVTGVHVDTESQMALAAGAAILTALLPMQDHVRSTLYLCGRPERAASVSAVQIGLTIAALAVLHLSGVGDAWVPFAALAIGCAGSMAAGLVLAPVSVSDGPSAATSTRDLVRAGKPLLPAALLQEATIFTSGALLVALTSAATLGLAEAARIISRPVQAVSLGISRSLAPRLMESGQRRSPEGARSAVSLYVSAMGVAGLAYLAVAGWSYPASPFVELFPTAYAEEGLVALFLVATLLGAIASIPRGILLGASEGGSILRITIMGSVVRLVAVVVLAAALGAYALPLAHMASLAVTGCAGARVVTRLMQRG